MSEQLRREIGEITDADVEWAEQILNLPQGAFGIEGDGGVRNKVLKSLESIDVEACPGSGKTTLVVAKLAILARKWKSQNSGLCVLSHTNVAREEIENRLGANVGRVLLNYPHFVGTIHAFVNEFVAIPWLRSKGYGIKTIEDSICLPYRWHKLPRGIRSGLEKRKHFSLSSLTVRDTDFGIGKIHCSEETPTYKSIRQVCEQSSKEGYFCHDEMLMWSAELLQQVPEIVSAVRARFPMLFIDEVQDNSESQSSLLFELFQANDCPVVRQRFGDSNQTIFNSRGSQPTKTDCFPEQKKRVEIRNSYRFNQSIADLVEPFGANRVSLVGLGAKTESIVTDTGSMNACFLFDDDTLDVVLPNYGAYLLSVFDEPELKCGKFTAVGARVRGENPKHQPVRIGNYWSKFNHELTRAEPTPSTFLQFAAAGNSAFHQTGENHHRVNNIARGIVYGAIIANPEVEIQRRRKCHKYLQELSVEFGVAAEYCEILRQLGTDDSPLEKEKWAAEVLPVLTKLILALAKKDKNSQSLDNFLAFDDQDHAQPLQPPKPRKSSDNVFRYPLDAPKVDIQLGSIHSVKGETHVATLVLETFNRTHHLKKLKSCVLGKSEGLADTDVERRKLHYVAMSRPSHLLCLAMRRDSFTTKELVDLRKRWKVAEVCEKGAKWL